MSIPVLTSILYLPFLGNELVFDDVILFRGGSYAHYGTTPFDIQPRSFPYFTLVFVDVVTGSVRANRMLSLALHIACTLLLFAFLHRLHNAVLGEARHDTHRHLRRVTALSAAGALLFALHPVAVYGAGYLVQRTIVFATIFSLLSALSFMRALDSQRWRETLVAALLFSAAVFSKEHAITAPFAIASLALVVGTGWRQSFKVVARYLVLCLPAMVIIVLHAKGVIGKSYEPDVGEALKDLEELPAIAEGMSQWLFSAIYQAGLFFRYLYYWIIPNVNTMSADIRIDFASTWSAWWTALKIAAFLSAPLLGLYLLTRRDYAKLLGFGLLYTWVMFAVELTAVRLQEPFVLYRSYLWTPGIMTVVVAALGSCLSTASVVLIAGLASPLLLVLGQDRLASLSEQQTLWEDAAAKLTSPMMPGADRILYNLGIEYLKRGQHDVALRDMNQAVAANPKGVRGYYGRGSAYLFSRNYSAALSDLDRAVAIRPDLATAHFNRGVSLEKLGRMSEAKEAYRNAAKLGYFGGRLQLGRIEGPAVTVRLNSPSTSPGQTAAGAAGAK